MKRVLLNFQLGSKFSLYECILVPFIVAQTYQLFVERYKDILFYKKYKLKELELDIIDDPEKIKAFGMLTGRVNLASLNIGELVLSIMMQKVQEKLESYSGPQEEWMRYEKKIKRGCRSRLAEKDFEQIVIYSRYLKLTKK